MKNRTTLTASLIAASLTLAACGSADPGTTNAADSTTSDNGSTESTTVVPPPTEPPVETTAAPTTTTSTVPGEPLDYGVAAGTEFGIIGVEIDDSLNFRTQPAATADIVASILATDDTHTVRSRGESWLTPTSVWFSVTLDGDAAWANGKYLAVMGDTFDITADIVAAGPPLSATTAQELALGIAQTRASTEPASDIVVISETPGDATSLAEVIVDVIGLGDDSIKGERLHVFATVTYDDAGRVVVSYDFKSVEATLLCGRGVSDGLCL